MSAAFRRDAVARRSYRSGDREGRAGDPLAHQATRGLRAARARSRGDRGGHPRVAVRRLAGGRSGARVCRVRCGGLRALLPQLLDVSRSARALSSRTCSSSRHIAVAESADGSSRISRGSRSNGAAAGWSGGCSTGTRARSDSTRSIGARPMDDWTVYRVDGDALARLADL